MVTIYQCDKCGAQFQDPGSIAKVDLVDMCKRCRTEWADLKKGYLEAYLKDGDSTNKIISESVKSQSRVRRKTAGKVKSEQEESK
ncbi:MAG: hypothetical protein WCS17_04960 [Prevotella sp.]